MHNNGVNMACWLDYGLIACGACGAIVVAVSLYQIMTRLL